MKNLFSMFAIVCMSLSVVVLSCESDEPIKIESNQETNNVTESFSKSGKPVKFKIYSAEWDEWGRTSKDCAGWGLCNYTVCWFCCFDANDNVVDCDTSQSVSNTGTFIINPDTNLGHLIIPLDPSITIQNDAIVNSKIFYVDNDIVNGNTIVHHGNYSFDSSVGKHGGYRLNVTESN